MSQGAFATGSRSEGRLGLSCTRIGSSGFGFTILGWRTLGGSEADVVAGYQVRTVMVDQWIEFEELR